MEKGLIEQYDKAVCCHPVYLTYTQSTSENCWAGLVTNWNQDRWEKYHNIRYVDDIILKAESKEELKNLLVRVKEESEKAGLKLSIKKTKILASSPITAWQIEGDKVEAVRDFLFLGSKITADGDCSHNIKRCLLLGRKAIKKPAAAAKSLQSCLTLCDPIDGSPPGSPIPGILQARILEWVAISFSNA